MKKKKLGLETKEGEEINHETGQWVHKEWWIDRDHEPSWYFEKITDPETGKVIKFCSEPLAEHVDHGSAKKKSE